ncbi:MAG: hypothetical protein ACOCZ5_01460 [bacterium]
MIKRRLGDFVNSIEIIGKFRNAKNITGSKGLKIRRMLKPIIAEIDEYNELRNTKIQELGTRDKDGQISISPEDPNYNEIISYIAELEDSEVSFDITPISIEVFDIEKETGLTNMDLDILLDLGLLFDPEDLKEAKKEEKCEELPEKGDR